MTRVVAGGMLSQGKCPHILRHMQCNDLHGIVEVGMTRVVAGGILPQGKC